MAFTKKQPSAKPIGAVRRAQMISTYGVGSMVAIGDQSFIVSGIDSWWVSDRFTIFEPRLQAWLRVSGFRLPPAYDPPVGKGVKVRQFPTIYSCSECHDLKEFRKFGSPSGKSVCGDCEKPLTPSRFVVACENGHLDDFPYFEWVHKKTAPVEESKGHHLSLHSTGRTASLRSIIIRCSCGKDASLEGAFGRRALDSLGIRCKGRRPWLGRGHEQPNCTSAPRTMQRGSSAAWFPVNRSSLSIPPWSTTLLKRVNTHFKTLDAVLATGNRDVAVAIIESNQITKGTAFTPDDVIKAVEQLQKLNANVAEADSHGSFEPASKLRHEEYRELLFGTVKVDREEDFECVKPADDPAAPLPFGIDRVMLVKRLREVRALEAFTRVLAPDALGEDGNPAAIAAEEMDWLPAIEVSGEGVFLTIDKGKLAEWEAYPAVKERVDRIRRNHTYEMRRRAQETNPKRAAELVSPVDARYVLLHTLAHALINEWSLESGYPAASLRERLYLSDEMAGALIYTATSDSAGSLGGVVAQGEYMRLRGSLESALDRISWCSQDPPCMESVADEFGSLNLAACYACVLLPETCCETNNTFLDRALLIGTPEDPRVGFFSRRD
ncbi:DUF1998 domain-containing protein [Actinocorallia libanotica]|uniref:DUF1998 domain-containing protein n=1 Tax=Actinocorallia libanotica TaxID=46162 RepID=A0ABP4BU20_9ACTN